MTVPIFSENPEQTRPMFRRLRELRDELARVLDWPLTELSMGMSHDFQKWPSKRKAPPRSAWARRCLDARAGTE